MTSWVFIQALTIAASLSPVLTLLRLWQMKEWRWDRLIEHFRQEGILNSLLSKSRIVIGGAWILGGLGITMTIRAGYGSSAPLDEITRWWPLTLPLALASFGLIQILTHRQPMPVWTQKARLSLITSLALTALIAVLFTGYHWKIVDEFSGQPTDAYPYYWLLLTLPYLQAPILAAAWLLLRPLDLFLKNKIMNHARKMRSARPRLTVIGITGSVGKTTTKELLSHILAGPNVHTTPAHVNTEMGVSAWMTKILENEHTDSTATLIVEMGAYRIGEIALLCSIAQPTHGIITSIGEQHMALFGSKQNICSAKGELFAALPVTGRAFLNGDSEMCTDVKARAVCPVTIVGTGGNGEVQAYDIEETRKGIRFTVDHTPIEVPLNGTHNVTNVLLAIACARDLGISLSDIAVRLRGFSAQKHTFEVRAERGVTVLDDTYNSSPQSFRAATAWAQSQPENTKILLFSGIIELGAHEATIHRELAAKAQTVFTKAYIIGDRFLPYFTQAGFTDASAIANAVRLQPGDLLVCVGRMPKSTIENLLPAQQ